MLVLLAGRSSAAAEPETLAPIQVTYTADVADRACPTYEQFLANVRRYTTNWRLAEGSSARHFRLVLAPKAPGAISGRLEIEERGNAVSVREIVGPDCEAAARALAIALAVVIDPHADLSGGATHDPVNDAPDRSAPASDREAPASAADPGRASAPLAEATPHAAPRPLASRESARAPLFEAPTAARVRLETTIGLTTAVVDVLLDPEHPGFLDKFVPMADRSLPPKHFADRGYPAEWWTAGLGVNADAVERLFLQLRP